MQNVPHAIPTLSQVLWPADDPRGRVIRGVVLAVIGTAILTASAKVKVPFWPVEMTMQTYVVLILAAAYGWRLGVATVLLYLAEGAMGLPVFTGTPEKGLGLAYMAGPTGGYLAGFVVGALVVGWLAERGWTRDLARTTVSMLAGTACFFALGLAWLTVLFGWQTAVNAGLMPFLLSEATKIALAVATAQGLEIWLRRRA